MFDCLNALIRKEIERIESHPARALLSVQALARFSDALRFLVNRVTDSTVTNLFAREVGEENPFAALAPDLLTKEQREGAEKALNERINAGSLRLPEPLCRFVLRRIQAGQI